MFWIGLITGWTSAFIFLWVFTRIAIYRYKRKLKRVLPSLNKGGQLSDLIGQFLPKK